MESTEDNVSPENGTTAPIDEAMLEMGDFISQMTEVDGYLFDAEWNTATMLEEVELSIPIQLDLHVDDNGSVVIGTAPPLYYVETTFMPVFHQLNVKINVTENNESYANSGK